MPSKLLLKVNAEYEAMLKDPKRMGGKSAREQMDEIGKKMIARKFIMKGKPFPTFLKPLFVQASMRKTFAKTTKVMMNCIEKVTTLYYENPEYRSMWEVPEADQELVMIQPKYPRKAILARLDAFLSDDGLKFLEFNTDSPSGTGWHDELVRMFQDSAAIREFGEKFDLKADFLLPGAFEWLITRKWKQHTDGGGSGGPTTRKPNVALVANRESTIRNDVELIIEFLMKEKAHKAVFADPRDFDYDGKKLTLKGEQIDVIWRDAIQDFTEYINDCQPVLNAYRDGNVCMFNPFGSRVGGLKCVLHLMSLEKMQHLFTAEEKRIIAQHLPWTRIMKEGNTTYNGKSVDLFPFVTKNKDTFVLKPNSGYGGFGVTIGRESDQKKWDEVVAKAGKENWVVQEFADIPVESFPDIEPELKFDQKKVNINFWAFDGEYAGGYVRVSKSSIINIHQGGGLVPIFYVA